MISLCLVSAHWSRKSSMAAKLLLSPLSVPWGFHTPHSRQHLLSLRTGRRSRFTVQAFDNVLFSAAPLLFQENSSSLFSLATTAADAGYSMASYYTSLGLFVISVPGLWSLIKRSVKSKVLLFLHFVLSLSLGIVIIN